MVRIIFFLIRRGGEQQIMADGNVVFTLKFNKFKF
jgi:hypothetical protein